MNAIRNKSDKKIIAEQIMRICIQLELVQSILWRMVNPLEATSDFQPIDTALSTTWLKNSAAKSVDISRICEYPALSI